MSSKYDNRINGWCVKYQPDFVKFFSSNRYLDRLNVGGPAKAKQIIEAKIRDICNSADPGSSTYPRLGNMKWLKAKKGVKIQEDRLTGDYRILFLPTKPDENELTFFAIKTHSGVQEFLRDAHARVHNAAMDEFAIEKWEEDQTYSVDMSQENAEEFVNQIQKTFEEIVGKKEISKNLQRFLDVSRTCSIYRLGKYGIELDPSPEQVEHINSPSPMLLPGVAGTGKSTVLQYRYRNAILSYRDQSAFFKVGVYLTLNKPLAKSTRREVKKILSPELAPHVDVGVQDINSWVSALLGEEAAISTPNLTFENFRRWWSKRQNLQKYDPAQAWEEYRGVIKGTAESILHPGGALTLEAYLGLPHDRCAYPRNKRHAYYTEIVEDFQEYRKQSNSVLYDDQDLIRKVKERKLPPIYKHIFIDEVQDLTELQLMVIMEMLISSEKCICSKSKEVCNCPPSCEYCHCLIFDVTGDLSQQVYPTRFRWEDTSRAIFESQGKRCNKRKPMSTSYRSVRSIVDLSSYYLDRMVSDYRQGGDITQAQAEQKAETPALLEQTEERLYEIIDEAKLPAAHCPIIVRNETAKQQLEEQLKAQLMESLRKSLQVQYPESKEIQDEEYQKSISNEMSRINSYILTIADAKGLEWNNVVLWEISSGSEYLLEKKLHEQRGKYIEESDWNYQLELRHAFVATTRARLLLLHLGKIRSEHEGNPFYSELVDNELVVIEKTPIDLSRFSKSELTVEEYEEMAEDYANKEMYGAAALIYNNNLKNPRRANEMDYFEAKKIQDSLLMAKHLISYERGWKGHTLGEPEKRHVLELLDENGDDTELGYVIEIATMLGLDKKVKMAELRRKETLAGVFGNPEIYDSIAADYAELDQHEKAGDYFLRAENTENAIQCWWKAKVFHKAWEAICPLLAPNQSLKYELLMINLLTKAPLDKDNKTLFRKRFKVQPTDHALQALKELNFKLGELEFSFEESKTRVSDLANAALSNEERALKFLKSGKWKQGLNEFIKDEMLDFKEGLEFCEKVSQEDLLGWYTTLTEDTKPSINGHQKLVFFEYLFKRSMSSKYAICKVMEYLKSLEIKGVMTQQIGANSAFRKWQHAVYCVKNPQDVNTGSGKACVSALVRWYTEDATLNSDLLLHTIRCAMFCSLQKTYMIFEKTCGRRISSKIYIQEALIVAELFIKTQMNPRRYSTKNYHKIRKALIGSIKHTDVPDFVDVWFDFFLDMQPDKNLLDKHTLLKRDIQRVFPIFKGIVSGFEDGLPSVGCYPHDSLKRRYDNGDKRYSFSKDGLVILKHKEYTKGQKNAVNRIIDERNDGEENLTAVYINEMILKPNKDINPVCFFELIEEYLVKHSSVNNEEIGIEEETLVVEEVEAFEEVESTPSEKGLMEQEEASDDRAPGPLAQEEVTEDEPVEENELGGLTSKLLLQHLHRNTPEDVAKWFNEGYKSLFHSRNGSFILECYTLFIQRLEQRPSTFDVSIINEWLCFHEILKVMRSEFNFQTNPYRENQRMAAELGEARRTVAANPTAYTRDVVNALISIR